MDATSNFDDGFEPCGCPNNYDDGTAETLTTHITPDPAKAVSRDEDNDWPEGLSDKHVGYLRSRGVSGPVARRRGYRTVWDSKDLNGDFSDIVKKKLDEEGNAALVIPLFGVSEENEFAHCIDQLRLDHPRIKIEGSGKAKSEKPIKFELPIGSTGGNEPDHDPADIHPDFGDGCEGGPGSGPSNAAIFGDCPVILTEGAVKGDALLTASLREGLTILPVSITGVSKGYMSASKSTSGKLELHPKLEFIHRFRVRRPVYICWDADWRTNPDVLRDLLRTGNLLTKQGCDVRYIDVPVVDGDFKSGVDDYLAASDEEHPLAGLLQAARPHRDVVVETEDFDLTNIGFGRHLANRMRHFRNFVYNSDGEKEGRWMRWTGNVWEGDDAAAALYAEDVILRVDERKKHSETFMSTGLAVASRQPGIRVRGTDFDADPFLLNTPGGIVDLTTGKIGPSDPSKLMSRITTGTPDAEAEIPAWTEFLDRTFKNARDPEHSDWATGVKLVDFMQAWTGMALIGTVIDECLAVFYGSGSNGKTTFVNALKAALGNYTRTAPSEILLGMGFDKKEYHLAKLDGPRIAFCAENGLGKRLEDGAMKHVTSRDDIDARHPAGRPFSFTPTATAALITNHKPVITSNDDGTWRRLKMIPFVNKIAEDQKDRRIDAKLAAEADGILAWAVEGARLYLAHDGLPRCPAIDEATKDYRDDSDQVGRFLEECCQISEDVKVRRPHLGEAFRMWQQREGNRTWSTRTLMTAIAERVEVEVRKTSHVYVHGLRLNRQVALAISDPTTYKRLDETSDDASTAQERALREKGWIE